MRRTAWRRRLRLLITSSGALAVSLLLANLWVVIEARPHVVTPAAADAREIIVVLGAAARGDVPSPVLERRLARAARRLQDGNAARVLASGQRARACHDETRTIAPCAAAHVDPM